MPQNDQINKFKVHIIRMKDLGCQRRGLDARRLMNYFSSNNCEIVDQPSVADYIIFITCAFRQEKEDECFKHLESLKKYQTELIVMGCLPGIAPDRLKSEFNGIAIPAKEIERIDEIFPDFKTKFAEVPDANIPNRNNQEKRSKISKFIKEFELSSEFYHKFLNALKSKEEEERKEKKVFLRISNGCLGNCSYCAIRYGTGQLKSKPPEKIISESQNLIKRGKNTIVITGEDTAAYGLDIGMTFPQLMGRILDHSNSDTQFRIVAFQPRWVIKYRQEMMQLLTDKRIKNLYIPIQSGSNRVLQLMNRYYDRDLTIEALKSIINANPDLKIFTHVIIGFPSETDNDFNDTLEMLREVDFDLVRMFFYTDRSRTEAEQIADKLSLKQKQMRYKKAEKFFKENGLKAILRVDKSLLTATND